MSVSSFNPSFEQMEHASDLYLKYMLVEPDIEKFADSLSTTFKIVSVVTNDEQVAEFGDNKQSFLKDLPSMHYQNIIKKDGKYQIKNNCFVFTNPSQNQLVWQVTTTQLRKGHGMLEDGEGWYKFTAKMIVNFCSENDVVKVDHVKQVEYNKEKLSSVA